MSSVRHFPASEVARDANVPADSRAWRRHPALALRFETLRRNEVRNASRRANGEYGSPTEAGPRRLGPGGRLEANPIAVEGWSEAS